MRKNDTDGAVMSGERALAAEEMEVIPSSGNVFADLGLPGAEDLLVKSTLARKINNIIDQKASHPDASLGNFGYPAA